jgi:hypothetical protein
VVNLLLSFLLGWLESDGVRRYIEIHRPWPVKGVVSGDTVLALRYHEQHLCINFCTASLAGGAVNQRPICSVLEVPPLRWSVGYRHVWIYDNACVHPGSPLWAADRLRRYGQNAFIEGRLATEPGWPKGLLPLSFIHSYGPVDVVRWLSHANEYESKVHVDYLPLDSDSVRVFLLTNVRGRAIPVDKKGGLAASKLIFEGDERTVPRWSFRTDDYKGGWDPKKTAWVEGKWTEGETLAVAFEEPFQVTAAGDDYFFVTGSGKVYRSPKPDKGKKRKTEPLWDDAKRPVVSFIQDADTGRNFVFCKPDDEGKGVYFELTPKPTPIPYDGKNIKRIRPLDPMPAVLGYAKILLADKKIKGK